MKANISLHLMVHLLFFICSIGLFLCCFPLWRLHDKLMLLPHALYFTLICQCHLIWTLDYMHLFFISFSYDARKQLCEIIDPPLVKLDFPILHEHYSFVERGVKKFS